MSARGDTVATLGGDEFVILLTDMANASDAGVIANKITEAIIAMAHKLQLNAVTAH